MLVLTVSDTGKSASVDTVSGFLKLEKCSGTISANALNKSFALSVTAPF